MSAFGFTLSLVFEAFDPLLLLLLPDFFFSSLSSSFGLVKSMSSGFTTSGTLSMFLIPLFHFDFVLSSFKLSSGFFLSGISVISISSSFLMFLLDVPEHLFSPLPSFLL